MQEYQRFVWWLVKQVVERALPGETGAQRAQQVAVLMTIWSCQDRNPLTAQKLSEIYGFASGQTSKLLKRLIDKGLLEREQVAQTSGRGVMYVLRVKETEAFKALKNELGLA